MIVMTPSSHLSGITINKVLVDNCLNEDTSSDISSACSRRHNPRELELKRKSISEISLMIVRQAKWSETWSSLVPWTSTEDDFCTMDGITIQA